MLTFEKIIEPVIPLIKEEQNRLKNDEKLYKLSLYYFMVSLIYAVINKTQSIRLLITEIKTNPDLKKLGFILASPSMYSEAFSRYKPEVFQRIFAKLIEIIGSSRVLVESGEADQDSLLKVSKIAKTVTHSFHCFNGVVNPLDHTGCEAMNEIV